MKKRKNKKKTLIKRVGFITLFLFFSVIGFIGGYYGIEFIDQSDLGLDLSTEQFILFVILLYVLYLLQILIHESGHYFFGRLTGYSFVSFRVGSFMLVRKNGRLKINRYTVMGTAGQCLMMPPSVKDDTFPFVLYNLGGVIANIISSLLSLILFFLFPENMWLSIILVTNIVISLFIALVNGIPLKLGLPNDGMVIYLLKNKHAQKAFWLQLHINGLLTKGERLRDMPEEWFSLPPGADLSNPLVSSIHVFRCEYFMDKLDFEKVKTECQFISENIPSILTVYKQELACNQLFLELIGDCRMEQIQEIYTKDLKQYMNATKKYISRIRLLYVYELFVNQDQVAADKQLALFEKVSENYPFPSEVVREREILEVINSEHSKLRAARS